MSPKVTDAIANMTGTGPQSVANRGRMRVARPRDLTEPQTASAPNHWRAWAMACCSDRVSALSEVRVVLCNGSSMTEDLPAPDPKMGNGR
jgi:hypothetical protein